MDELNSNITNPIVGTNTNVPIDEPLDEKIPVQRKRILHDAKSIPISESAPIPTSVTEPAKIINTNSSGRQRILHSVDENPTASTVLEKKLESPAPVENVNNFTGKTILEDVDAEINKTVKELKISGTEFGNMAREVIGLPASDSQKVLRNRFLELTEKKRNIERQLLVVPESLQKEVIPALTDPPKFKKIMEDPQYSPNQITKAINTVLDKGLKAKEKVDNEILTSTGGMSFSSLTDYVNTKDNNIFPDEIDRMYGELSKRPDYINGDYKDKQTVINKFVNEKLKEQEYPTPAAKLKQANEYRHELGLKYAFAGEDDNGNTQFTVEGLKMFVENERNILLTHRNDLINDLHELKIKDPEYAKKLGDVRVAVNTAFHIGRNPDAYLEYHYSQLNDIDEAVRAYDKVLATPEKKRGLTSFVPDIGRGIIAPLKNAIDRNSLLTLGVADIFTSLNLKAVTDKEMSGDQLTFVEQHNLKAAATIAAAANFDTKSLGYEIGSAVTAMLPYVATYGLTSPVYEFGMTKALKGINTLGKTLVPEAIGNSITKAFTFTPTGKFFVKAGIGKISTVDIAAKNLARIAGAELQNIANPQTLIPAVAGRMTPKIALNATLQLEDLKKGSELNTAVDIVDGSDQKFGEALGKGNWDQLMNLYTERFGGPMERWVGKTGRGIGLTAEKLSKMVLLKNLMKMKGIKTVSDFNILHSIGWHGAQYEYFEELANTILAAPVQEGGLGDPKQFIHQQLVTLGSILVFSPGMAAVSKISEKTVGKNVVFEMPSKTSDVPTEKVSLPRPLYNQLMRVMGVNDTEGIDPEKLNDFIDFHKPNLDEKQVSLILQLSVDLGQKKYAAQLINDNQMVAEPGVKPLDKVPSETDKPGLAPNLAKQKQIKEIEDQRSELLKVTTTTKEKKSINDRIDKRINDVKNAPEHFQTKTRDLRTGKLKYVDMSPDEVVQTKAENDRVLSENSDLFETGLLKYDPMSNQWVEPTGQMLVEDLDNVTKELQNYEGSKYEAAINDPKGFVPANAEETDTFQKYTQLIAQHEALKDKLVEVHARSINFQDLAGEEKAHRLTSEIKDNGKLEGVAQKTGTNRFGVKLSDGRLINAALDMDLSPKEKKKAQAAISKGTQVVLQNRPFNEYDPEMKQSWSNGTPVMSKVTAYTLDGTRLGSVLINSEPDKVRIREEKNKNVIATSKDMLEGKLPKLRSMILPGNINDAIAPDRHIDQDFFDALNNLTENLTVPIDQFIPTLKSVVQDSNISLTTKQRYLEYIEKNKKQLLEQTDRIRRSNMSQKALAEKAAGKLNLSEIEMEDVETTFLSGEQKLAQNLNTFGKVWRYISVTTGISKDKVERTFFRIANNTSWEGVTNETTFENFLTNLISTDTPTNAIVGAFKELGYGKAQSFFQFYRNVELVPQIATLYSKGKITFKTLNTSDALQDFIEQTKFTLENYIYVTKNGEHKNPGYESVQYRMARQDQETEDRFHNYTDKTPTELEKLRRDQFEADKQLLAEITGIPTETWNTYFEDPKTKEMEAIITPNNSRAPKINFKTYDAYLASQTYRYSQAGKPYPRWHSQLVYSLLDIRKSAEVLSEFTDAIDKFFFKGDEEKNTFSNLAKLATSSSTESNLGLSGQDVSRNRFSSLVQNNSIFYQLRHLDNIKTNTVGQEESDKTKVAYQGHGPYNYDSRDINYFTLDKSEAEDYGTVRKVFINTTGFLNVKNDSELSTDLLREFYEETGKTFDILDNSNNGLKTQKSYFQFLSEKGYKGYDGTGWSDSQYLVSFNNNNVHDSKPKTGSINNLLAWLKSDTKNLKYFFLNGISDTKRGNNTSQKMTTSDILISLFSDFLQKEDTYNQWTGQYGDKTHMLMLNVPKYTEEQLMDAKEDMANRGIDLIGAIQFVKYHTTLRNGKFFEDHFGKNPNEAQKEKINNALESFVLNFTRNIADINEITRGNWSQYEKKGLVEFVKRGATSISPGMALDGNIEGGIGHSYKFASFNDGYKGIEKAFDGMCFFRDAWSKKLQITLGSVYSKIDKNPRLSSAKLLHAGIDPSTGNEAITKANWLNIDMLANELGGKWADLRDFMDTNNLDVLSPKSSTKKHENGDKANVSIWDIDGNLLNKSIIPDGGIVERRTDQLLYQQDLRHTTQGKLSKTPSAILGNILGLPHGSQILGHLQDIQDNELSDFTDLFNSEQSELVKIKWLKENVNEQNQGQLLKLINAGLSIHDPAFKNIINNIVASAITKKVLEVSMMRITSQEILDVDGVLKGREASVSTPGYIHLPEAMAAIAGGRESILDYIGKPVEAIAYVMENKDRFLDLFNTNGKLMDWIIKDKNGKIPGEPFVSVRIPTDDYRSFTVARLEKNLTSGNFTMLDHESQMASGSDADGDQRFNLLLSKSKSGKMTKGVFGEKLSNLSLNNMIVMDLVHDYQNPINDIRIRSGINVEQFDPLIAKELGEVRSQYDIESYFKARAENIVGLTAKAMFTDLLTTVNILQKYPVRMNNPVTFHDYTIDGIVNDKWGLIKLAMANVQNMSFDNSSKPRIEHLGFNEHASPMIFVLLMGNKALDSDNFDSREQQSKSIETEVAKIKEIFTGEIATDFRDYMREDNDALQQRNTKQMWKKLHESYDEQYPGDVAQFKKLYEVGQDLDSIRKYFALSKTAPDSYAAFRVAVNLHEKISLRGLTHFNTRSFFTYENGEYTPIGVFKMIPKILDVLKKTVYADSLDETPVGRLIHEKILARYTFRQKGEGFGSIRTQDIAAINHSLNTIAAIRSLGITKTFRQVEREVLESINKIRQDNPGNKFFTYTQKVETSSKEKILSPVSYGKHDIEGKATSYISFEVDPQFHHSPITEVEIQAIRDDFDKLDNNTKDLLTAYALYKWGPSMSRDRGSYMAFVGDQYHVNLSQLARIEHDIWANEDLSRNKSNIKNHEGLSDRDIYNILRWTTIASRSERIRPMSEYTDGLADINSLPINEMSGITQEAADELMQITDIPKEEKQAFYNNWIQTYAIDLEDFRTASRKAFGLSENEPAPVIKFIEQRSSDIFKDFQRTFPPKASARQIKNMMPYSAISSVLLTEDPELRDYTYARLKEVFPDVQFFSSRQAFYDFVEKHEGNLRDASPEAIGHAFKQAVFIDEKRAVQESIMHEYSHIYWDGLPDTNKAKRAMQKLYNDTFAGQMSQEDIDETIILDIGHAGSDIANISLRGTAIEKFKNVLRQFWIEVKKVFGQVNRYDLINDLAWDVWNNEENIRPSTNIGKDTIRDMVEFDDADSVKKFEKLGHKHTIGGRPAVSVTEVKNGFKNFAFDIEEKSYGKQGLINYEYKEQTGEIRSKEKNNSDASNLQKHWGDAANGGTTLHLIGQAIFNWDSLSEDDKKEFKEIKSQFAPGVYEDAISTFEKMKDILITRYGPHIKFISERQIISKKYMISGIADLIIDLGDETVIADGKEITQTKLIIVDYKSVNAALATIDEITGEPILEPLYTKSLGSFQKPFAKIAQSHQSEYSIQLNMYANVLEEQENESGNKNVIKGLVIFPIIRKMAIDGKIIQSTLSQHVDIKRNSKLAQEMMSFNWEQRKPSSEEGINYARVLSDLHYHPDSIKTMIKALSFFQSYTKNDITGTKTIDPKTGEPDPNAGLRWLVMDNMMDGSYSKMISKLYELGFENDDIVGNSDKDILGMPLEHMFYIALSDHPITKQEYIEDLEKPVSILFPLLPVDVSYQWKENPNYSGNRYSHQIVNGKDVYGREIGWNSDEIGKGTRVGLYVNIQKEDGTFEKEFIQGEIEKVDKALHSIVINTDNGKTVTRKTPDPESGIMELFDKKDLPQTPEKLGIVPNTFEPKWISILTEKKERHYRMLQQDAEEFKNNTAKYELYKSDTKKVQKYFTMIEKDNKIAGKAPIDALKAFLNDKNKTINMYNLVSQMDKNAAGLFTSFMESISTSHQLAEKVRTEYQYGANDLMHFMIDTYRYLTINDNVLFRNFEDSWVNGRGGEYVPTGEIEGSHIPFQLITAMVNDAENGLASEEYEVKKLFSKLNGKFKFGDVTTENSNGEIHYLRPSQIKQNQFPEIYEFLDAVYYYYYKYDPRYQGQQSEDGNYKIPILIRKTFASEHELRTKYGISSKYSARFRDMMRSNQYDNIKVPVQVLENGKWVDDRRKDKDGKLLPARVKTLKEIKDTWSYENMTDQERREFLGSKYEHRFTWPGKKFKTAQDNPHSQLLRYYYLAEQVMKTNGDKNNPNVFKQRKQLTARGSTQLFRYQTQRYYENEESIIVSMISSYYKREIVAPWKMISAKYQKLLTPAESSGTINNLSDVSKYLIPWGQFMIYDEKNPESTNIMEKMSTGVDFLNKWASRSKIMYTVKTQIFNLAAGQFSAWYKYPKQNRTGWSRILSDRNKAFNILRKYKVASFTDQLMMERIDREWRIFGLDLSWIENMGYWLVENVEKINQIGTYIGFMTDKEWNAYDSDGEIIEALKFDALSPTRQTNIANKLYKTQGHYGKTAMAPGWLGAGAKAGLGLKRYLPGYYWALALRHSRISDVANSGIIPSLILLVKVVRHNLSSESKRELETDIIKLKRMADEGVPDILLFEKNTKDVLGKILQENNNITNRIRWRELSENDKSNMYTLIRAIGGYALMTLGLAAIGGGGDDDKLRTKVGKGASKILTRIQGDIYPVQGPQSLIDQLKRLMTPVAFDMIYSSVKLSASTMALLNYGITKAATGVGEGKEKAFYTNAPNNYIPKGFPKAVVDFLKVFPGGNSMTQVWSIGADLKPHFTFVPENRFNDANIDDTMLELVHGDKKGLDKLWSDMVYNVFANKDEDSHVTNYEFTIALAKLTAKVKLMKDYDEYKYYEIEGDRKATIENIESNFEKVEAAQDIALKVGDFAALGNAIRKISEYDNEGITDDMMKEGQHLLLTIKKNASIGSTETKVKKAIRRNNVEPIREDKKGIGNYMKGTLQDIYSDINQ